MAFISLTVRNNKNIRLFFLVTLLIISSVTLAQSSLCVVNSTMPFRLPLTSIPYHYDLFIAPSIPLYNTFKGTDLDQNAFFFPLFPLTPTFSSRHRKYHFGSCSGHIMHCPQQLGIRVCIGDLECPWKDSFPGRFGSIRLLPNTHSGIWDTAAKGRDAESFHRVQWHNSNKCYR